jgi:hypothetical protein
VRQLNETFERGIRHCQIFGECSELAQTQKPMPASIYFGYRTDELCRLVMPTHLHHACEHPEINRGSAQDASR